METTTLNQYVAKIDELCRGGSGSGGEVTVGLEATGRVRASSIVIHTAGSGYAVNDVLTMDVGSTDPTLTVTAVDGTGGVTGVTLTTAGVGVSANGTGVTTTVAPTGGTGCKISFLVEKAIGSYTIVNGGSNYIGATAVITGGDGTGGELAVVLDTGAIDSVTIVNGGWYLSTPTVTIVASAPSASDFRTLLIAFDNSLQTLRLLEALEDAAFVVIGSQYSGTAIDDVKAEIINLGG